MNIKRHDIIIVGGGLIGLALSCFLEKLGLNVAIIEKNEISNSKTNKLDTRTTAISEGSKEILDTIGLWQNIKSKSQPIVLISVVDRNISNNINFFNPKRNKNLGYIAENYFIKKTFLNAIFAKNNIHLYEKRNISNIIISDDHCKVITQKEEIFSKLIIAADGKNSFVRKLMKLSKFTKNYNQSAIVINFLHKNKHNNRALELFYNSGPLATLPMQSFKKTNASSLVWSHNNNFIESLSKIENNLLKSIIDEKIQNYLGKTIKIINKKTFRLSAHINSRFFSKRLLYIGDSAHSIHPIAGQGWNLGMRDLNCLVKILKETIDLGLDIGSNYVCKRYHDNRYFDAFLLYQITDKLNSIFMKEDEISYIVRTNGFSFINFNNLLKNKISDYAINGPL